MGSALKPVQEWYAAVAKRDWDTLRSLVDPEIEFIVADGGPGGGNRRDLVTGIGTTVCLPAGQGLIS